MRQLTLCPSSMNSLEPSPNLVPSEVPASGRHRFAKWGQDAQNGKIGRLGRPSRVGNFGDIDAPSLDSQTLIFPSGPMPWVIACCHAGCLLFTEGMTTRTGQKATCGAKGGIVDRTQS